MKKLFETVFATSLILLACLGFLTAIIEAANYDLTRFCGSCLLMLIFLISTVSTVIIFNDDY